MKTKKGFLVVVFGYIAFTLFSLISATTGFAARPGINLESWGITTWTTNSASPHTSLEGWISIVDYDGIANDGSSHTVTVTYPDTSVHTLEYIRKKSSTAAYYELFDSSIPQPINPTVYNGTYTFRVVDSNSDWSEVTDILIVNPIDPPVETTFQPNFSTPETLAAYFDDVYINGILWDDFNGGINTSQWTWIPQGVTGVNNEARFEKTYATPSGTLTLFMDNEPAPVELKATVRAETITGDKSRAYIAGNFWNDGNVDFTCHLLLKENTATYFITRTLFIDNHCLSEYLICPTSLGTFEPDNKYELSIEREGTTITFHVLGLDDGVDFTAGYTISGTLNQVTDPNVQIGIGRNFFLDDTTPVLSWAAVSGAAFYRIRFYSSNQYHQSTTVFTGYSTDTSYAMPPGVLKPNGIYTYRIEACRDHQWVDGDNRSASNPGLEVLFAGPDEAQDPFVDLWSSGVQTWSMDIFGGTTFTNFYIKVHDAQGVPDNIQSVTALFPDHTTQTSLYLDYNESSTCGIYRAQHFGTVQPGEYTFTVVDKDGNPYEISEDLTSDPISPPLEASLTPPNNSLINSTEVHIDWDTVADAALYDVIIYNQNLYQIYDFLTTASEYTIPPGLLAENTLYRYRVFAKREFFEENSDNGSATPWSPYFATSFLTTQASGSESPGIDVSAFGAAVMLAPDSESSGPLYILELWANVVDSDGVPGNIEKVEVTFPDNTSKRLLTYLDAVPFGSNYRYSDYFLDSASIQEGTYIFRVVDFEGHEATVSDTLTGVAANSLPWVTNVSPVNDAVVADTTPVIFWDGVSGAAYYKVRIMDSWANSSIFWSNPITDFQFKVPAGILDPHTVYCYKVYAFREAIDSEVDYYSSSSFWNPNSIHFTTGQAPGELQALAGNFGRTDCTGACFGNSDGDNDVDGADLANYIAEMDN
jgi:hypothetical protein